MAFLSGPKNSRGGYAPRKGRGGWSHPLAKRHETVKPDLNKNPLGDLLVSLKTSDLTPPPIQLESSLGIRGCQYVASYNWLAGRESTILVPGQPPQWTPLKIARRLPEDSGSFYRDPNAARSPEYPMVPAVQAVMNLAGDSLADVELFACGSTLGNLLRFARGTDKAFRFHVEVIGDTVFFVRKENDPKELIEGVRGFGHSFPDAYTTWPEIVKGSETHQRIVQYNLGGIQCLVRFECDGYLNKDVEAHHSQQSSVLPPSADDLAEAMLKTAMVTPQAASTSPLSIKQAGKIVPQTSIFDLKTRSGKHGQDIRMDDITPQLWLKQIPNFIVAYHDGFGLFKDIQIRHVRTVIADFEKENADAIGRHIVLISKIIAVARSDEKGLLEVYSPGGNVLEIRRQYGNGMHALPEALNREWAAIYERGGLEFDGEDTGYGATDILSSRDTGREDFEDGTDDSDEEKDFTACSAEICGYCGRCTY